MEPGDYECLFRPLEKIIKEMNGQRTGMASHLMHGHESYGLMNVPNLVSILQYEKYKMIQCAQEHGGTVRVAAQNLLTKVTEFQSIPITDSSPVMLGCLDTNEIRTAKNSISSAVEYVDKEGGAWGRKGTAILLLWGGSAVEGSTLSWHQFTSAAAQHSTCTLIINIKREDLRH
jgi:hypothetical protein